MGSAIVDWLARKNYDVTGTSRNPNLGVALGASYNYLDYNSNRTVLEYLLRGVETVIFAAGANEKICKENSREAFKINSEWPERVASAAKRIESVNRFIYISTVKVYADAPEGLIDEASPPTSKETYGVSHLEGEHRVHEAAEGSQMRTLALRVANIVGAPRFNSQSVEYLLPYMAAASAIKDGYISLRGNGLARRDFISLSFLTRIVGELLSRNELSLGGALNVGSGRTVSIREVVERIASHASKVRRAKVAVHYGAESDSISDSLRLRTQHPEIWKAARPNPVNESLREMVSYFATIAKTEALDDSTEEKT